jgi:hypothetical protein
MALPRRKFRIAKGLRVFAVGALALLGAAGPLAAAIGDRIVSDRHTGIAIFGFDPVAYFTDATPVSGRPEFELQVADVIWRFRSEGNRAAFVADPDIYQPRYGGYDPMSVARGIAVPGNPLVWLVSDDRLYFFHTPQAREAFAVDPETAITVADERWPAVQQGLAQ